MFKINLGRVSNSRTGEQRDIIANALCSSTAKTVLIGGGLVLAGVTYLVLSSFRNGAVAGNQAEHDVFLALDLIEPDKSISV